MCVGKTNRKNPESNKALARYAASQAQQHQELISPLEIAEIEQLQDEGYQGARTTILEGRANADAAAAEHTAQMGLRANRGQLGEGTFTGTALAEGNINEASQSSRTKGVMLGKQTGEQMTLNDRFQALNTGQGHSRGITSGLASASRNELVAQEAQAAGEMQVGQALGGLIATGAMGGLTAVKRANDPSVATENLSLAGKGVRSVFGPQTQTSFSTGPGQQVGPQSYGNYQPASQTNPFGGQNAPNYAQLSSPQTTQTPSRWQSFKNWI